MPFGEWEDHEACVIDMQEEGYTEEEAHKICQSIENEAKAEEGNVETLLESLDKARNVMTDLGLELVSAVETPAQPSNWITMKSEKKDLDWKSEGPILLPENKEEDEDEDERKALAPALVPNKVDKEGDVVPTHVVIREAHRWLKNKRGVDEQHNMIDGKGKPVESYTLKEEREFETIDGETKTYPKGTWMLMIEFEPDTWKKIKNEDYTGLSIAGRSEKISVEKELDYSCECLECGFTIKTDEHCKDLTCPKPDCGGDMRRKERPGEGEPVEQNMETDLKGEEDSSSDTMSEQTDEDAKETEETNSELKDAVESLSDTVENIGKRLDELEKEMVSEDEAEKQGDVENLTDALDLIDEAEAVPQEAVDLIVDAVRGSNDEEESADNDEGEEKENPDTEKSSEPVRKGHSGEGTRKVENAVEESINEEKSLSEHIDEKYRGE